MLQSTWAEVAPRLLKVGGLPCARIAPAAPGAQPLPQDVILNPSAAKDSCLLYRSILHLFPPMVGANSFGTGEADRGFSHLYSHRLVFTQLYFLIYKNA